MADLMGGSPFGMQPQRRPMGLFRSPAARGAAGPVSSPIGGDGASATSTNLAVSSRFPSAPRRFGPGSVGLIGSPMNSIPGGGGNGVVAPAASASPLPGSMTPPTPQPSVPPAAGPYNYGGPTMNLLGMTNFSPAAPPMSPMPLLPNPDGFDGGIGTGVGGNALNGIFGGGRRLMMQ